MKGLRGVLLFAACLGVGCGKSGPTESNRVNGSWLYSVSGIELGGRSCSISDVRLGLEQVDQTFSGTVIGGTLTCVDSEGNVTSSPAELSSVSNGRITGSNVSFLMAGDDVRNEGTIDGNIMEGTVTFFEVEGGPVMATFHAERFQ